MNTKKSSKKVTKIASNVLRNQNSSEISKSLAASVLSQTGTNKQTGVKMEEIASNALKSDKYSKITKTLAGSVLSQSNGN